MRAGRVLAVRRSELGNNTSTTSPRLSMGSGGIVVVVYRHFRAVPILGESREPCAQFGGLLRVNAVLAEVVPPPLGGTSLSPRRHFRWAESARPARLGRPDKPLEHSSSYESSFTRQSMPPSRPGQGDSFIKQTTRCSRDAGNHRVRRERRGPAWLGFERRSCVAAAGVHRLPPFAALGFGPVSATQIAYGLLPGRL